MSTIIELAKELRHLKDVKEKMSSEEKIINSRIDQITKMLLPQVMEDDGVSTIKIDGIGKLSLRGEMYVSILAENRQDAYQWLRDNNRGSLISETVNASTLKAAAKEWIKSGVEIPDLIKITPYTMAILSK